jgi:hypothetical protein
VPILFHHEVFVSYAQFYVDSRGDDILADMTGARAGQTNGLCGAAIPGLLYLTTGLHTGTIEVTIEAFHERPPVGEEWEEVVEVSFRPASERVSVLQWAGEASWSLLLEQIDYRVRYCVSGLDAAHDGSQDDDDDDDPDRRPPPDRHLLQLWPAPPEPDSVIRQTSRHAAYWHADARSQPAPGRATSTRPGDDSG